MNDSKINWDSFEDEVMNKVKKVEKTNHNNMLPVKYVMRSFYAFYFVLILLATLGRVDANIELNWTLRNWMEIFDFQTLSLAIIPGGAYFFYKIVQFKRSFG